MEIYLVPVGLVTLIGILAGLGLALASKFMAVPVDETFDKVRACLPGVNCGACGYAGCDDYAKALTQNNGIKTNLCIPGGDGAAKAISEALGVEFEDVEEQSAVVRCAGNCEVSSYVMDYEGPQTCAACNTFYQGRRSCSSACLGYGDCVDVCQYDAIHIENGVAVVDKSRCVGCGMCAKMCPNNLITIVPFTSNVTVTCSSHDKGAYTRKVCKVGCIGCRKCEKSCPTGAITVNDNLAAIDPAKCINCEVCVGQCPTGAIQVIKCKNLEA